MDDGPKSQPSSRSAFDLDLGDWRPRLKRLFELRNAAVHPKMQWVEPQKHLHRA